MRCPVSRKSRWIRIDLQAKEEEEEDFSFFPRLYYMYIFRLTMRDLFNGRESGNGIRTRCSWEPFRSALASSSFAARTRGKMKKRKTASITKLARNLRRERNLEIVERKKGEIYIVPSFRNHSVGTKKL